MRPRRLALPIIAIVAVLGAGCGGGEEATDGTVVGSNPNAPFCGAWQQLRTDMESVVSVNVVAEGTNGLKTALQKVQTSADELKSTAAGGFSTELEAMNQANTKLRSAVEQGSVAQVPGALGDVRSAWDSLERRLRDTCGG